MSSSASDCATTQATPLSLDAVCASARRRSRLRFDLLLQAHNFCLGAAAVHVLLREHGAEPPLQRAASHVVVQLTGPPALAIWHSVQLGVEPVGEFAPVASSLVI